MVYHQGMKRGILPEGEALRRAVRWLARQEARTLETIEAASRQFDLSPAEEEFLIRHFLKNGNGTPPPND